MTGDQIAGDDRTKRLDRLVSYNAQMFQNAANYTNLIMAGGYAAFFAVWSGISSDISRSARLWAGGLITCSLMFFIAWELWKAFHSAMDQKNFGSLLLNNGVYADDFEARWDEAVVANNRASLRLQRFWIFAFAPAVGLGVSGAGVLAASAFIAVFCD